MRLLLLCGLALPFSRSDASIRPRSPILQQAQPQDTTPPEITRLAPINVTATRSAKDVFRTPKPVTVLDQSTIREQSPNSASDLFRELPGIDVTGVGANQVRPSIRGQRGQRILVLQDGIRLNNSRRQQDFGEIPGLVDVNSLDRIEIVRGPASVLYGSDAIGGVINLISRPPTSNGVHGSLGYRYSSHDTQHKGRGSLSGRFGRFAFRANSTIRDADPYEAPAGSFGDITLAKDTTVFDTGVQDESFDVYVGYDVAPRQTVFAKVQHYDADTTGFGFVDPAAYAPDQPRIQILYPFQNFDKITAGYQATGLGTFFADKLDVVGYYQDNDRRLNLDIFVPFGPTAPPGAGVAVGTSNFTDISTVGFRLEASKLAAGGHLFTYGVDFFRDDSKNTDSSATTVIGFGPPMTEIVTDPSVPNASFRSLGVFAQGDLRVTDRGSLIVGARYQDVHAETEDTPGITNLGLAKTDRTLVASANALYEILDNLNAVATVGRAFRSPNLVERFFNGPTPEGGAFQVANPNLEAETSLNVDLGLRYRDRLVDAEGFFFRNEIRHGIRIESTGNTVNGLPEFRNVNVEKLRYTGFEFAGNLRLPSGVSVGANYTHLSSKNVLDPNNPVGDTFDDRVVSHLRFDDPQGRFWAEYNVRHNGERKDIDLGTNPIGDVLPAFTVHSIRGGVTVLRRGSHVQRVGITIANLTNELYAEFANASFFRPEPRRSVLLTWDMAF